METREYLLPVVVTEGLIEGRVTVSIPLADSPLYQNSTHYFAFVMTVLHEFCKRSSQGYECTAEAIPRLLMSSYSGLDECRCDPQPELLLGVIPPRCSACKKAVTV